MNTNTIFNDVRYGLRQWKRTPGFTAIAVLTLALGIGATTAMFSLIYSIFLAPMPYPEPDRVVMIWPMLHGERQGVSPAIYLDWKRQNTVFESIGAWGSAGTTEFNLSTGDRAERIIAAFNAPSRDADVLQIPLLMGRHFLPEEGEVGRDHVVILTHRSWQSRFGSDPNIIGKQLRLNGEPYTVVGVARPGPADRMPEDLSIPLSFRPEVMDRKFRYLYVMGRLKPGVTLAQANASMKVLAEQLAAEHPDTDKDYTYSVELLRNDFVEKKTKTNLGLLSGAVGFVLLIACANIANLLLARGATRQTEVALRASLGASRARVFRQLLIESLLLAIAGGAAGVALAVAVVKGIIAMAPVYTIPSEADPQLNVPVLLFSLGASMLAGLLFGCLPAWQASSVSLNEVLKEGRSGIASARPWLRRVLVASEFALALTLLAGAGLAIHSFWNLSRVDIGVRKDHVLTFGLPIQQDRFKSQDEVRTFYDQLVAKMEAVPGVMRVGIGTSLPLLGTGTNPVTIVGRPPVDPQSAPAASINLASEKYFDALGVKIVRGRGISLQDGPNSIRVVLVNETFVRRYLADTDPLGERLSVDLPVYGNPGKTAPFEFQIVGVFHDIRLGNQRDANVPGILTPFSQYPWPSIAFAVLTAVNPETVERSIASVVHSMDADLPLINVKTMDRIAYESVAMDRFLMVLYGSFAGVALFLAALGIYGVMAFSVTQRTHEIGLRMALGAGKERVLAMVIKEGSLLALAGLLLGSAGAAFVGRAMKSILFGVGWFDVQAFGAVAFVLLASALLASYIPARRAARVDPMVALRYE
ncbi:MAG TPA: ABC transporter permease [Terriglobales bacterium]